MASSDSKKPCDEAVNCETFMTEEEIKIRDRKKFRELEVLKSELNSVKKSGRRLFISSYPNNPVGTVLFLINNSSKLRSQVEKDYQSMRKMVNNLDGSTSNELNF